MIKQLLQEILNEGIPLKTVDYSSVSHNLTRTIQAASWESNPQSHDHLKTNRAVSMPLKQFFEIEASQKNLDDRQGFTK